MRERPIAMRASILGGFTLSALLLWMALRQVDGRELARTFASMHLAPLLLSAVATAASMAMRAVRWRLIAGQPASRHHQFARATYLGLLVNQIFPARLGELVRVLTLAKLSGSTFAGPLASAVLDRLTDILVLIGCAGILYLALPLDRFLSGWMGYLMVATGAIAVLLGFFVKGFHWWETPVTAFSERWLRRWSIRPDAFLHELRHELDTILSDWTRFSSVAAIALVVLSLDYLIVAGLFLALEIPLSLLAPLLVLFCLAAGSALPSAPGYIGIYQAAAIVALAFFSQPAEKAVALATILQISTLAVALAMNGRGVFGLIRRARANLKQMR